MATVWPKLFKEVGFDANVPMALYDAPFSYIVIDGMTDDDEGMESVEEADSRRRGKKSDPKGE